MSFDIYSLCGPFQIIYLVCQLHEGFYTDFGKNLFYQSGETLTCTVRTLRSEIHKYLIRI